MTFPCKNCEKRTVGCHASCEPYLAVKSKHDANREQEYQEKYNNDLFRQMKNNAIKNMKGHKPNAKLSNQLFNKHSQSQRGID